LENVVAPSKFADEKNLTGRDPFSIRLHEICSFGPSNWNFRQLAQGRWTGIEFCKNNRESMFLSKLLSHMRQRKIQIDTLIEQISADKGLNSTDTNDRTKAFDILGQSLVNHMLGMVDKGQAKLAEDLTSEKDLVRQLQEQVKQLVDAQKAPDAPDQQLDHGVGTDLAYSTNLKDFVEHLEGMPGSLLLKKVGPM
jgi:hypothetical protein